MGDFQPEQRKTEISSGPDKKMYSLVQLDEETLSLSPWPFEEEKFQVSFETRLIKQIQFSTSEEFRNAFLAADVTEQTFTLKKEETEKSTTKAGSKVDQK